MTSADVANIIPVVDILGSGRQKSLEVLHTGNSTVLTLELISGERTLKLKDVSILKQSSMSVRHLKLSATVDNINGFFYGQITPHRNLQNHSVQIMNRKI